MPYLVCEACGFRAYSAAGHTSVDDCPVCGTPLPRRRVQPLRVAPSPPARRRAHPGGRIPALGPASEIEATLGWIPAFFEPALPNPEALRDLWHQTRRAWLDSPVPERFRLALVDALADRVSWPWRVVADELARMPAPGASPTEGWPAEGSPEYDEIFGLTLRLMLDGPDEDVRTRLQTLLGARPYASLIGVLTYLGACRMFAVANPRLVAAESSRHRNSGDPRNAVIVEIGSDGTVRSFGPEAEALFGCDADAVVARPARELFDPASRRTLDLFVEELSSEADDRVRERSFSVVGRRQDGDTFDAVLTLANRTRLGERGGLSAVVDVDRAPAPGDHSATYRVLLSLVEGQDEGVCPDAALDAIATALGWQHVLLWCFDSDQQVLYCESHRSVDEEAAGEAEERSHERYAPGAGIVGTVFQTGAPAWVEELHLAPASKLRSGLWLPYMRDGSVAGVVELLSTRRRAPGGTLMDRLSPAAADAPAAATAAPPDEGRGRKPSAAGLAFEGAPVGMALFTVEPDGPPVIAEANRAMALLTGRDQAELEGVSLDELTAPEDAETDAELLKELLAGSIPSYEVEKRFRAADGSLFWGQMSVSLIWSDDEARRPLYLVVQLADIGERKRMEDAVHASRDRLAGVFDDAPVGMALATLDCRWIQVNEALCQTLGFTEAELLTKNITDLIVPEDVEMVQRYLKQLFEGEVLGYHVETRACRADSEAIWIQLSVSLVHDYYGSPAYIFAEVQDVTERKRLEEELEQGTLLDPVTGLPSRTLLFDRLDQARSRLERTGSPFVVMFAEITGFQAIISTLGRERCEAAMRDLSAQLVSAVRPGDTVARYGVDEYVILCEDLESEAEASEMAARIIDLGRLQIEDAETDFGVTVGITVAARSDDSPGALVERAEAAMRTAKLSGDTCREYSSSP